MEVTNKCIQVVLFEILPVILFDEIPNSFLAAGDVQQLPVLCLIPIPGKPFFFEGAIERFAMNFLGLA